MKKTLILLLIVAAVAGGVFAQTFTLGGQIYGNAILGAGTTAKAADGSTVDPWAAGSVRRIRFNMSAANADNTIGAWARFESGNGGLESDQSKSLATGLNMRLFGYAWWQPIPQFKLQIGTNPSGHFEQDSIARWGFYDTVGDVQAVKENWYFTGSFFPGYALAATVMTLAPVDGLTINVAVPFEQMNMYNDIIASPSLPAAQPGAYQGAFHYLSGVYKNTAAQIQYAIKDVGKFGLTYQGGSNDTVTTKALTPNTSILGGMTDYSNAPWLYLYGNYIAVQNLAVELGVGYQLKVTDTFADSGHALGAAETTLNSPVYVGVAATYKPSEFGFKARVQGQFGGSLEQTGLADVKLPLRIVADVMPMYTISDGLTLFVSLGLVYTAPDVGDSIVGWYANPYLRKDIGSGCFIAGIRVDSNGQNDADGNKYIGWAIPVAISYSF